jgi:superfamily II RNA helicase
MAWLLTVESSQTESDTCTASVQVGTVLLMCWDEVPEETALRNLLTGPPTRLESQFRLTYNMILNLLRVEDLKVRAIFLRLLFRV